MVENSYHMQLTIRALSLVRDALGKQAALAIVRNIGGVEWVQDVRDEKVMNDIWRACRRALSAIMSHEEMHDIFPRVVVDVMPTPPMKIKMMLHFATTMGPFAPEEQRCSASYVRFVKELLAEGLIERPSNQQRRRHPGWAYKSTPKGRALCRIAVRGKSSRRASEERD